MSLKISNWKIFSRLFDIVTVFVGALIILFIMRNSLSKYDGFIVLFLIYAVVPSLILFIEYLSVTYKQKLVKFSPDDIEVRYRSGHMSRYNYNEIEVIKVYKAAGNDKGSFTLNINENYYFAKIIMKDGRKLILTSLLGPDLGDALEMIKDVPVDRTKTGYAFIFLRW